LQDLGLVDRQFLSSLPGEQHLPDARSSQVTEALAGPQAQTELQLATNRDKLHSSAFISPIFCRGASR
jgi:hypothetical protein